jgi:hypothetical protein
MYFPHADPRLQELFAVKPYQGADPASARFLFFGLDANYAPNLATQPVYPEVVSYLEDGVGYWKRTGFHHPFRSPGYRGDGKRYHDAFAEIGFSPEHAEQVSFVELIDVPTSGRSKLHPRDLRPEHLTRLREWVLGGAAHYVFIPSEVLRRLAKTSEFAWLPRVAATMVGSLPVLAQKDDRIIFRPFHFSAVGRYSLKKDRDLQMQDMRKLITTPPGDL